MLKNKIIFTNKMKRNKSMVLRETCILVVQAYRQNNDGHIPEVYTVEEANTTCQLIYILQENNIVESVIEEIEETT